MICSLDRETPFQGSIEKRMLRIFYLIDQLSFRGGTENQLIYLSDNLPRDRYDPVIGILYDQNEMRTLDTATPKVYFKSWRIPLLKNMGLIWKLHNYIRHEKFDIVQTQFVDSDIYGALSVSLMHDRPILINTRRNMYHWTDGHPWQFRMMRATNSIADYILTNSHSMMNECQRIEGIEKHKIRLINNSVDIDRFSRPCRNTAQKVFNIQGAWPLIGVVANWRPVKGIQSFLRAASLVSQKIPTSRFILVGHGSQEPDLRALTDDLGLHEHVEFLDNGTDIPVLLAALDIAVQPSLSESFSNVLIEYMAAGKPVVATRVGDAERVIENGREGLLVQPNAPQELADAILDLCTHRDNADLMGQRARMKVLQNWSCDRILDEYDAFYQEITNKKKHS